MMSKRQTELAIFIGGKDNNGFTIQKNRYGKTGSTDEDGFMDELIKALSRHQDVMVSASLDTNQP